MMCSFSLNENPSGLCLQNILIHLEWFPFLFPRSNHLPHWLIEHLIRRFPCLNLGESRPSIQFPTRFFQKVCIDCSPSSVRKVHPVDSGDTTTISRWTCCCQWWFTDVASLVWRAQRALSPTHVLPTSDLPEDSISSSSSLSLCLS
jgi:hypothetical protein